MSKTAIEIIPSSALSANDKIIKKGADELIVRAQELIVASQDDMENGATVARAMKSLAKKVEDIREGRVKPLNEQVKAINATLKTGISDRLIAEAKKVEAKMLSYTIAQQKKATEEEAARQKQLEDERFAAMILAQDAGEDDQVIHLAPAPEVLAVAVPQITRSSSGAIASTRNTWAFEVLNIADLALARPDLVEAITSKINAEIKGEEGNRSIPGLRIYQQETMSVR